MMDLDRLTVWLTTECPRLLPAFLRWQRWFGGKARALDHVDIDDVVWLAPEPVPVAFVVASVCYAAGESAGPSVERYALIVGVYDGPSGGPTIGRVDWDPKLRAVEASSDGAAMLALLGGAATEEPLTGVKGGRLEYADTTAGLKRELATGSIPAAAVKPVGAEQSNTSIRVGTAHVFKLFRRLEDGENPQLEVGRFLSHGTDFRSAPTVEGSLSYRTPGGVSATVGVTEGWLDSRGDGWSYVVRQLESAHLDGAALEPVAQDMFRLGSTTAELHLAFASDPASVAFAPEPVTSSDIEGWRASVFARMGRVVALVEQHHRSWPGEAAGAGRQFLERRAAIEERVSPPGLGPGEAFSRIRLHGDYHLGQTLKTTGGFAVIDFEGEPTRSLAERREKHCALKDVAGMVRSFDYAVETVRVAMALDEAAAARALERLRAAFLEGYRGRAEVAGAPFLPAEPWAVDAWIRFFELEKALYEVEYEVNNRPAWIAIPLRGILRLAGVPS